MRILLKKLLIIFIELAVIAGVLWFIAEKRNIRSLSQIAPMLEQKMQQNILQPFPSLESPISRTFSWTFKSVKYDLPITLYQSVFEYYQKQQKKYSYTGELPQNWEDDYYGMFLKTNENDQTIAQLANSLQALGKKHNLNDDQIVELTLSFVQAIQYDDAKAENILAKTGDESMLYPYEILFQQKGVCSDKSLLEVSILRQMGYGVAIFAYEQNNHMAVGIQCPKSYSSYDSGYCYAETTSVGNKIGIIPQFDAQSNKPASIKEIGTFDSGQEVQQALRELGQVTVYQATQGKKYGGIVETRKIENEIGQLKTKMQTLSAQLAVQKKVITRELADLKKQQNDLEKLSAAKNFEKYNALVEEYNVLVENYKKNIKTYNNNVTLYNQTVGRYNLLIKQ